MGCYWVSIKNQPSEGPRKRSLVHVDSVFFNYLFLNFENFFFQFSNEMWFYQNGHCFKCSFHGNFYWVDILHFTEFLTIIRYSRRFKIDLVFVFCWFDMVSPSFTEFWRVLPSFTDFCRDSGGKRNRPRDFPSAASVATSFIFFSLFFLIDVVVISSSFFFSRLFRVIFFLIFFDERGCWLSTTPSSSSSFVFIPFFLFPVTCFYWYRRRRSCCRCRPDRSTPTPIGYDPPPHLSFSWLVATCRIDASVPFLFLFFFRSLISSLSFRDENTSCQWPTHRFILR